MTDYFEIEIYLHKNTARLLEAIGDASYKLRYEIAESIITRLYSNWDSYRVKKKTV